MKDAFGFKWTFSTRESSPSDADMKKAIADWEEQEKQKKENSAGH